MSKQIKTISVGWAEKFSMGCPVRYEVVDRRTGVSVQITKSLHDRINRADMGSTIRGKTTAGELIEVFVQARLA